MGFIFDQYRFQYRSIGLGQLIENGWILERARILGHRFALGDHTQQAAHDLARAGFGQVVAKTDVLGLGNGAAANLGAFSLHVNKGEC